MLKKAFLIFLVVLNCSWARAQKDTVIAANHMKPAFQKLLLELSTTFFTVVKENQVDLDSSLIHASHILSLSRLQVVADGIDKALLNNTTWVDQRNPAIGESKLKLTSGRGHAALCILLGAYYAFEPGNNSLQYNKSASYLTTGIKECDKWNDIKLKLTGQRLLAKLYLKTGQFAEADKLFAATATGYFKARDTSAAAETYAWWGLYAPVTPTSTKPRIEHLETATALFKSIGEKEGQLNALMNDGYVHMLLYDLGSAVTLAKQSLELAKNIGFPYSHYISGALMSITTFQGKFGEPLTYAVESIKNAETQQDNLVLPYYYGAMSGLYESEGTRQEIQVLWERKAVNSFLKEHELNYMDVHGIVCYMIQQGHTSGAIEYLKKLTHKVPPSTSLDHFFYNLTLGYIALNGSKWREAHTYYDEAAKYEFEEEKHGLSVRKPSILLSLGDLYYAEGNYKQAKIYFKQYLSQPSIINGGFFADNAAVLQNLVKIDSLTGDFKSQLKDYRKFTDIIIQNYTVSKTKLAEELQVKYATADRINQIKLLNQKAKLEQENLQQANLTKNIFILGIILVVIIAGLLYRQSRIRKRNNEIITRKNVLMQKLLDEKEWLVKEIHHRVKNNLHTVICLLESQALYLENDALKAVENSRHRIYAMSLIHQKLYQSDDIKVVNMKTYLADFVAYLEESFGSPEHIRIMLDADEIKLSAGQAIPIGLIVNEAITNAFKYAFPGEKDGEIRVKLKCTGEQIYFSVADNGIGFTQEEKEVNSLGLELIKGLALDLRGELVLETSNGTTIQIRFEYDPVGISAGEEGSLTMKV